MKKYAIIFLLIISASVVINSCKKEDDDQNASSSSGGTSINASITGQVTDESGQPVSGVSITVNGIASLSDSNGIFLLQGQVTKNRCVLTFDKSGFLKHQHGVIPESGKTNYVNVMLRSMPSIQQIQSSTGGTLNTGSGGTVTFPANAFVIDGSSTQYNGNVSVTTMYLSTGDPNFSKMIPGGDLAGKNSAGKDVNLYSYGMTSVTLTGSAGEHLQLASGITATIKFPIASAQSGNAPVSIPLWYLDESETMWKEEGQATRVGNDYIGTVSHFTWWNCDYGGERSSISGRVVDCEGVPVANVVVTVNSNMTITTDQNGNYSAWVPSGIALTFQVLPQGVILLPSQLENVAALLPAQNFTVPDLVIPCGAFLKVTIVNCNSQAVPGFAFLYENNSLLSYQYSSSGSFRIRTAANAFNDLVLNSETGAQTIPVTTPNFLDSLDMGSIQLCNTFSSSNGFTINGQSYINETVNYFSQNSIGDYWVGNGHTLCQLDAYTNIGHVTIEFHFQGQLPTSINFINPIPDSLTYFFMNINGSDEYVPEAGHPFMLNITDYGNVGDSIKGTFSGELMGWSTDTNMVVISNGRFAVIRGQDQQ
jgi:hypothetical protein